MTAPLRFGTDGWRATWPDVFTLENVARVSTAVAQVMHTHPAFTPRTQPGTPLRVVVGYDTRHLSPEAAQTAAEVFVRFGFHVLLTNRPAPTPALAFALRQHSAVGAVMITASHNPPHYNGLKVFGPRGESAPHAACRVIESVLDANAPAPPITPGTLTQFDPLPDYLAHLATLVDRTRLSAHPGHVIVDAMHGTGGDLLVQWLAGTGWRGTPFRANPDPEFGGDRPEPILPHLQPLVDAVLAKPGTVGLAHDGDADRIGAVDETGRFVGPQLIFPLVLRDLIERRGWRGPVAKTVSTTVLVDRLCTRHGLPLIETPVGFQDIANVLLDGDGVMGGEESGGMSVRGHVPQGDGILLGLLLLEAMADANLGLHALVDDLLHDLGPVAYQRQDVKLDHPLDKKAVVLKLTDPAPHTLAGHPVERVSTSDGVKYYLAGGSWLLIRPSGTEPVLRVYAEGPSAEAVAALCAAGRTYALQ